MDDGAPPRIRRGAAAPADGAFGMAALAAVLEPPLREVAGVGAVEVSVSLEFAKAPHAAATLAVEAWVERTTRTLVFAAAEARADGAVVGAATAIFNRVGAH